VSAIDPIEKFRQEVKEWLEANCPPEMRTPTPEGGIVWVGSKIHFDSEPQRLWYERMRDKRWFAPGWPVEYGGGGLSPKEVRVLERELSRMKCRLPMVNLGIWMIGPIILEFGTEEQKRQHIPKMCSGEASWCQGFSEPNAGSDLASLKMRATIDGDDFVLAGSKIWTSYAQKSDWMYCLIRTDPEASNKQQGISLVLLDMASPGITVKPIELISGKSNFCQVFFDDVRVPRKNMIGELNGGWPITKKLLQYERGAMAKLSESSVTGKDLTTLAQEYLPQVADPVQKAALRDRIAACIIDEKAALFTMQRVGEEARAGGDVGTISSIFKYAHGEEGRNKYEALLALLGHRALGWEGDEFSEDELMVAKQWLLSWTYCIAGGTSEIQLNVIAKRILGLPS
jgi:alkylation response protein AidB-like acyl-CoA dehydrogenase